METATDRSGPRSSKRPRAPAFGVVAEPTSIARVTAEADAPSLRSRLRTPMDDANDVLRRLQLRELVDVLQYAERLIERRGKGTDPEVLTAILAAMGRLYPAYRTSLGVPIPVLRSALLGVPRTTLEEALLEAELRMLVKLVPTPASAPFVEAAAGIHVPSRGLLYYCAAPDKR
jgi:hypothetical protein